MKELLGRIILLSRKGLINTQYDNLNLTVKEQDGTISIKKITSIQYLPNGDKDVYVYFDNGFGPVLEGEDKDRIFSYILRKYPVPENVATDVPTLQDHMRLRMDNLSFICQYGDLQKTDFENIERIRSLFIKTRQHPKEERQPLPGDIVEGITNGKETFNWGVITSQKMYATPMTICVDPYRFPWAVEKEKSIDVVTSGGPFIGITKEDLEYVGTGKRYFNIWSHTGPTGNGALNFSATVNKWKYNKKSI